MGKRFPFLLGMLLVALAIWLQISRIDVIQHWIARLESLAYDVQLRAKLLTHHTGLQTNIAIVDVDDKSLEKEGRWPWPRSKLAVLVDRLHEAGAVVIAFDMLFPELEPNIADLVMQQMTQSKLMEPALRPIFEKVMPFFNTDAIFVKSLAAGDEVVAISFLPHNSVRGVLPPPLISLNTPSEKTLGFFQANGVIAPNAMIEKAVKNVGFINVFPDEDGVVRRVPILMRYGDGLYPSLALEAVRVYLLNKISLVTADYGKYDRLEGVKIGNSIVATDAFAQVVVPFRGKSFTFPFYSAVDVLHQQFPPDAFTGKIVFVGTTAVGLSDLKPTSVQSIFPGIEINATIADGLLKKDFSYRPEWVLGAEIFFTALIGFIFLMMFPYFGPRRLAISIIFMPVLMIFIANTLSDYTNLIIHIFVPLALFILLAVMNLIYGYLFETRRREHLKEMFGQYVPEDHIDEMIQSTGDYGLYGEDREMTVLFADIRNFTTISEPLTAKQLKDLLNDFFTPMTEIIFKYRGTIDKYVGDLIMAFWGAPMKDKRHAIHALHAALEMQKEVARMKPILAAHQVPEINIGIGLNTGIMSVGDMGSKFRRNYTVLGDAVNLASRVESLSKYYDAKIIATENTARGAQEKIIFKLLDRVRVKGKNTGVAIYEVVCRRSELTPKLQKDLEQHHAALAAYFHQHWEQATELFTQLQQEHPHSKLYTRYLERIAEFVSHPPPADWDGIYTHTKK